MLLKKKKYKQKNNNLIGSKLVQTDKQENKKVGKLSLVLNVFS